MKQALTMMRPQDVIILLKLIIEEDNNWTQLSLAKGLKMSQSEISESISRSKYARLIDTKGKHVQRTTFMDLLKYGIPYVFPQQPGRITRGVLTAHSAPPLSLQIQGGENYVWPYYKGESRGQAIIPLYPTVPEIATLDSELYEMLTLIDALRVGKAREKNMAIEIIKERIC